MTGRWVIGWTIGVALACAAPAAASPAWLAPFPLGLDAGSVAIAGDGTTFFAGLATDGSTRYAAVQVRPPGGPLLPVQDLSQAADSGTVGPASVAVTPSGRAVAAWSEGAIEYTAVLTPGSTSFGSIEPIILGNNQSAETSAPAIDVDAAGDAFVLFGALAFDVNTNTRTAAVQFTRRPVSGSTTTSQLDSTSCQSCGPEVPARSIAVADDGAAVAAWDLQVNSVGPTTDTLRAALRPAGGAFGAVIPLDSDSWGNGNPQSFTDGPVAAMSPSGQAGVAWTKRNEQTATDQTSTVWVRTGTVAGGLGSPAAARTVAHVSAPPSGAALAITPAGDTFAGWHEQVAGTYRPIVAVRAAGAGAFTTIVLTTFGDPTTDIRLVSSPGGAVLAGFSTYATATKTPGLGVTIAPAGATAFATPTTFFGAAGMNFTPDRNDFALASGPPGGDAVATLRTTIGSSQTFTAQAAGYDATPPALTGLAVPATGTAGDTLPFSVQASDIWGPVTTRWDFGDGATADGASAAHAYASAGDRTATVTATDAAGNATSSSGPVSIAPARIVTPPPPPDTTPPVIAGFTATHLRFAATRTARAARLKKKKPPVPRGTVFRFTLSEAGATTIVLQRVRIDRHKHRHYTRVGTLHGLSAAGLGRLPFRGWIGKHRLPVGSYRAVLRATDAAKNTSKSATLGFHIVHAG